MKRFADKCCPRCFHSREKPCSQLVQCCLNGPLCHEDEKCSEKRQAIIQRLAHSPDYRQG